MQANGHRSIVKQIIQRLKRDRRGFGERPWSYFLQQGLEPFVTQVLRLEPVIDLLPYASTGNASEELTRVQQERLKKTIDRFDRYGVLVEGWKRNLDVSQGCVYDLDSRLKFWASRNVPDSCWDRGSLSEIVSRLSAAIQGRVASYSYDQDLLSWAIPCLVAELEAYVAKDARYVDAGIHLEQMRGFLYDRAAEILERVRTDCGIHGIEPEGVTERAMLHILHAGDAEYPGQRDDLAAWALDRLKAQIRFQVLTRALPDLGPEWYLDAREEMGELVKRRLLLQAFGEIVSSRC